MICAQCNRNLILCIYDGWEERIAKLESSPFLAMDWRRIRAERFLRRFDIQRDKEVAEKAKQC